MRASATAVAVVAGLLAASGCGGSGVAAVSQPVEQRPLVVPMSAAAMRYLRRHLYSARFLSPTRLAIPGILGSGNCPSVPVKLIALSSHSVRIDLVVGSWSRTPSGLRMRVPHRPKICLTNLVRNSAVVIRINPTRIDVHHQLKVSLYYPKGVVRRYRRPVVFSVPPLATARIHAEVRAARASNARLFSIFPKAPGERRCGIPRGAGSLERLPGICRTSVQSRPTEEPSVSVTFTESWWPHCPPMAACSPRLLRHHAWQVIEGEPVTRPGAKPRVYAIRSRGATAPQLR